ncbi:SufD family Fe-S cluster assembly protein [Lacticaseibacillus pabuli]|uniref:SufD family Fe-S cluster assembly protein n=1 Tax=Lacticaseibacillus pabuli TaxID=3025672 RepID=A0ABY7WNN8_9LACO|nr:SufD family Fe-S cluster assembly protein [Lacticaseibacillus sp. KACC 23028]WDF81736.1 SufD family Fe-S cluster assembly protein [Lacticaseibacillus sp. KACC 23028]
MKQAVKREWPLLPKMSWRSVLPDDVGALSGLNLQLPPTVSQKSVTAESVAAAADDQLAKYLVAATTSATCVTVPDNWRGEALVFDGPAAGVVQVNVGHGAKAVIREIHQAASTQQYLLMVINIEEDAEVDLTTVDLTPGRVGLDRQVNVARNAQLHWHAASFGADAGFIYHSVNLNGQGATADAKMAALTTAADCLIVTTAVTNVAPKTDGLITQHGVASGSSQLFMNGIGAIVRGARGSNAQQENRVLMLNDQAEAESNPLLLIDENDVTAGHAASVSAIDRQQMYYLMSRGLQEAVAVRLVVRGFLLGLLPENLDQTLAAAVQRALATQLGSVEDEHEQD